MYSRIFSIFNALVALVLVFTLTKPMVAFADDGQPGDATPEATEEAPADDSVQGEVEKATPPAAQAESVTEEATPEEVITEEAAPVGASVSEETVAEVVEALAETYSVLVDAEGRLLSVADQETVELLENGDPWFQDPADPTLVIAYQTSCAGWMPPAGFSGGACIVSSNPIQSAINAAPAGATVHVEAGTFIEQIQISKNLTLVGSAGAIIKPPTSLPIVFSSGSQIVHPMIYVSSGNVTIAGFTLDGADYSGNGRFAGIAYNNARGSITDNTITNFFDAGDTIIGYGIYIGNTAGVTIVQNSITDNEYGVYTKDKDTTINNNNIIGNEASGVWNDSSGSQTGTVDAQYNYWGCSGGANAAGCDTKSSRVDSRFFLTAPFVQDADSDGVSDASDNCPAAYNPDQANDDGDSYGNVCDQFPNDPDNDIDGDDVGGDVDNCPLVANGDQADGDGDGLGNVCDQFPYDAQNDADGDGIGADTDNCPVVANSGQEDADGDGMGDACDLFPNDPGNDIDGDGVGGDVDNCPLVANADQTDTDGDGLGNACDQFPNDPDNDADKDGIGGESDNCPFIANATQTDSDGDNIGDACDPFPLDRDNDGVADETDNCPNDANAGQEDDDGDGTGDACDGYPGDFDNDGKLDSTDNCAGTVNPDQADSDGDGFGDACDPYPLDGDNDSVLDAIDNCAVVFNPDQQDSDADWIGDACDPFPHDADNDADADGIGADSDNCPTAFNPAQEDSDADGLGDPCDQFPSDPDNDIDSDAIGADSDNCPAAYNPDQADLDGDHLGNACDPDADGDGADGAVDNCPAYNPGQEDTDGDGTADACDVFPNDFDNDGVGDATDSCIAISNADQLDSDGDGMGDACDEMPFDFDNDGTNDGWDNCTEVYNPQQVDSDHDGIGNLCDATPYGEHSDGAGGGTIYPAVAIIPVNAGPTVYLSSTIDLDVALHEFANNGFPLQSVEGEYVFSCVLETVTVLDVPFTVDGQLVTVIGHCSYLANDVVQIITVALGEGYAPGEVISVTLGGEELEAFAASGDPADAGYVLVPLGIEQIGNVAE